MNYPVFVINLDRQPERYDFLKAQLNELGITPCRISAVDGRNPAQICSAQAAWYAQLTPGEIGCFESHRKIWRKMIDENIEGAFVLEDDVVISSDFQKLDFQRELLEKLDAIKIDESAHKKHYYGTGAIPVTGSREIIRMLGTELFTSCYFITQRGANRMYERARNYILPVDIFMFDRLSKPFSDFVVWKLKPAAAVQLNRFIGQSNLDGDFNDRIQGAARPEQQSGLRAFIRRQRLRLRRLFDRDTRRERNARAERNLETFKRSEPVSEETISFISEDDSHYASLISRFLTP